MNRSRASRAAGKGPRSLRSSRNLHSLDQSRRPRPKGRVVSTFEALPGGFADRHRCVLRYTTKGTLTSSIVASQYLWAGNDVYDPDVTSTGSTPPGFYTLAQVYNRFKVIGSRARLTCMATASTTSSLVSFGARQSTGTGGVAGDACRPRHAVKWVNAGVANVEFDMQYQTQQVLGLTNSEFGEKEYIGLTTGASPSHRWYWGLRQESFDSSTSCPLNYMIVIDYFVEFFDRFDTSLSGLTLVPKVGGTEEKKEKVEKKEDFVLVKADKIAGLSSYFR